MSGAGDVLSAMLAAAEKAAGAEWGTIKSDVTSFAQDIVQDTADTASNLAQRKISEAVAKEEFDQEADFADMIKNYETEALKVVAQSAFNAAVDTLWVAISKAIP